MATTRGGGFFTSRFQFNKLHQFTEFAGDNKEEPQLSLSGRQSSDLLDLAGAEEEGHDHDHSSIAGGAHHQELLPTRPRSAPPAQQPHISTSSSSISNKKRSRSRAEELASYNFSSRHRQGPCTCSTLPLDLLKAVVLASVGSVEELTAVSAVSTGFALAAFAVRDDEDSVVWERRFRDFDPVLHRCMLDAGDERSS